MPLPLTGAEAGLLFAAAVAGGAVNSVAGGGSLITFPTLVFLGRDAVVANATNTVSLSPGSVAALWGFRRELIGLGPWVRWGTGPSLAGGVLGALLLLRTPTPVFEWIVPWLIAFATLLFALSGPITAAARRRAGSLAPPDGVPRDPRRPATLAYQLLVAVYGGYFGAGIGIMMLAGLALAGFAAIHRAMALRNYYAICINGIAALWFVVFGAVDWADAAVLTAGQIAGGWAGARVARRLSPIVVRSAVIAIGAAMAISLLLHP
jgi:uncharacterized membrane protein YfcA